MQHVSLSRNGHIARVTLGRERGHNALSIELCQELRDALALALSEPDTRVVILASSVSHFCVGADLRERRGLDRAGLLAARETSAALTTELLEYPLPVVGAAHGFALGGGLELLLTCDVVVADSTAVLGLPESRIGIVPGGGGTQLLTRRVGWGRASELVLTGRRIDAAEAAACGLVDVLTEEGAAVSRAEQVAQQIAAGSPRSVRLIRQAMRDGHGREFASALEIEDRAWRDAAQSPDYQEGLAAFTEKRPPVWPS